MSAAYQITLPVIMDLNASEQVLGEILTQLQRNAGDAIMMDMSQVSEISTPALQLLISASENISGHSIRLTGVSDVHHRMFNDYGITDELQTANI